MKNRIASPLFARAGSPRWLARRPSLRWLLGFAVAAAALLLFAALPGRAQEAFIEGVHYTALRETQPVQTGEQIEVVELFWYRCPHCFRLEPYIARWKRNKPANAELVELPAILNDNWAFGARIYYTLEALGLAEQLHSAVFNAIHRARRPLNTREQFADWAAENGADRDAVMAAFDSFAVESKMRFAGLMSRKYRITGVPAIVVDGKYRTSVQLAGSHERLLEVINHLVDKAAKERG